MKRVLLLYLPGAGDALLSKAMAWMALKPWRPLRLAFPPLPSVLQATLESGQPPATHGVFGRQKLSGGESKMREPWLSELEGTFDRPKSAFTLATDDHLLKALEQGGATAHEHATAVDDALHRLCDADEELSIVVVGGPSPTISQARLDAAAFVPDGAESRVEGFLLRIDVALSPKEQSRAIMEVGIERVLQGESRIRRGCDHPEAGQTLILAERGWSFEPQGQPTFDCEGAGILGEPFVAVCGGLLQVAAENWPGAIHDLRIAPTVAAYLGLATDAHSESGL